MKQKPAKLEKGHTNGSSPVGAPGKKRTARWLTGAVALLAVLSGIIAAWYIATADTRQTQRVVGRWLRPDGGYILEIRAARADGQLEAAYFNPRPIHVAKATYERNARDLSVFVELRDVNYPGSTYSLHYLPGEDRLIGDYYQALQGQTFDVEFTRTH